jgi:hypothetical protein
VSDSALHIAAAPPCVDALVAANSILLQAIYVFLVILKDFGYCTIDSNIFNYLIANTKLIYCTHYVKNRCMYENAEGVKVLLAGSV